ncbi:OLC1v1000906C1 [Oldenlandia corymbosa var. corymbosa]|uniref:OLC1v1000906C1 n=1 Tax=Oldenlandia corymbosa var. corymbosa TaxID=529605 RepID=A0AAV1D6K7_OLDCO|nr:OLC1v1000906C1 [Oldenlandia corymbosa var. corymbosa]
MDTASQADSGQHTETLTIPMSSSLPISSAAETRSTRPLSGLGATHQGFMGKHRMAAAIAYLDQQIQIIQEEIDQLETLGESSIVCKELLAGIDSIPDALLPVTKGPVSTDWERWFQGGHGSRNRKRWI